MTEFDEWWRNKNKEGYYRHCTDVALDIWNEASEKVRNQYQACVGGSIVGFDLDNVYKFTQSICEELDGEA